MFLISGVTMRLRHISDGDVLGDGRATPACNSPHTCGGVPATQYHVDW